MVNESMPQDTIMCVCLCVVGRVDQELMVQRITMPNITCTSCVTLSGKEGYGIMQWCKRNIGKGIQVLITLLLFAGDNGGDRYVPGHI